ncbi:MAG TPA: hypothetical protein VGP65_16865, partial [Candidatus Angelobacter sp.]|nr:hypothetical protein [Candidatus Angelobacter sp.]
MAVKSGSGAATASGVGYQNRVAAYLFATALAGVQLPALGEHILSIGFETAEKIDDLNVQLVGGPAYFQVKRKLTYSTAAKSTLRDVLAQFTLQFESCKETPSKFFLITTSDSSRKITGVLNATLDAFRQGPEEEFRRDQPKESVEVLDELLELISTLISSSDPASKQTVARQILRKSHVWELDIEENSSL